MVRNGIFHLETRTYASAAASVSSRPDFSSADSLEPEGSTADAAAPDLAVPEEHSWRERFAFDLAPAGGVDEEHEHVLLSAVQARAATGRRLGRGEVSREFANHVQDVDVPQP